MLDLGMPMEARQIWNDAVLKDHRHVESIYNNALFLWRQAEIDGYEAYRRISETPPSENRTHFLDEILRESGCDEDHFSMEIKLPVVKIESMYDYDADRAGYMPRKNEKIPGNLDPAAVEQCRKYLGDLKGYTFELNQQGNLLAAGGRDGVIYVWSLPDMVLLFTGRSHRSEVMQLAFSHQGNMLASFDTRREVRVWSIPDGRCVKNLYSVFFNMNRIAFSKDDSELKIYFHSFHRTFPIGPFTYKAPWYLCRIGTTEEAVNDRQLFRERMEAEGFELLPGEHPIVPVMLYDPKIAHEMAARMLKKGVYVVAFCYPVVPRGRDRIRTQISAGHSREDLEFAVRCFAETRNEMGI